MTACQSKWMSMDQYQVLLLVICIISILGGTQQKENLYSTRL